MGLIIIIMGLLNGIIRGNILPSTSWCRDFAPYHPILQQVPLRLEVAPLSEWLQQQESLVTWRPLKWEIYPFKWGSNTDKCVLVYMYSLHAVNKLYIYINTYIYIYIYVCIYTCTINMIGIWYMCIYICIFIYTYMRVYLCVWVWEHNGHTTTNDDPTWFLGWWSCVRGLKAPFLRVWYNKKNGGLI